MRAIQIFLFISSLLPLTARAQWQQSDITKITYSSVFGGAYSCSNAIWLEISPNGTMRMYNDSYAPDSVTDELIEHGSGTMQADDFKNLVWGDSLACYYTGKMTSTDYIGLTSQIIRMSADTTVINYHCCCDIPYQIVMVYFKKGQKKYMRCGGSSKESVTALIHYLNNLAYRPGYSKAITRFTFKLD